MLYFKIFDRSYVNRLPVTGIMIPRDLEYLRRTYNYNKARIEEYYLTRNFAVKNTHILSRFIEHVPLMPDADYYDFLPVAEDRVEYLTKFFEFTSGIEKGIVHPPYFFGNKGAEIIISDSAYTSKRELEDNWKTIPCVHALQHQRNDLRLLLPTGKDDGAKGGLSTIAIDATLLAAKYNMFIREQNAKIKSGDDSIILNKNNFVSKYVLPGFLETEIDHIFLNRLMDIFYGNPIVTPKFKHRFMIIEAEKQVDRMLADTLTNITSKKMDFVNILNNIHLIFNVNATQLLSFVDIPNTRQSNWAFVASRLRHMCFLYDVARDNSMNTKTINEWKLLVKRFRQDRAMLGNFDYTILKEINSYMDKIEGM